MPSILKIKDENGQIIDIPVLKGDNYVLTETDKVEIAEQAASLIDAALLSALGSGVIE